MNKKKGYMFIFVTTILFSLMEIALKSVSGDFNPVQITFSRFLIGGLVLLPFAVRTLRRRGVRLDGCAMTKFALLGFLGMFVSMNLYQMAILYTNASVVAVLFSSNPLFVTIFAYFMIGEAISRHNVAALGLDVIGIVLIIQPWNTSLSLAGVVLTLLATLSFALYGVLGKKACARFGGVTVTCMGFLFGSVEMMVLAGFSHLTPVADFLAGHGFEVFADIPFFTGYSLHNLLPVIFIYVGVTGIGFASYFMAMEETSAQTASLVFFFKPILAPIFAMVILGELIPMNMAAGILLILLGSLTSLLGGKLYDYRSKRGENAAQV